MDSAQIQALVGQLMTVLGTTSFVAAYFSDKLWIALTGLVLTLSSIGWSAIRNRLDNRISSVAASPEVAKVILYDKEAAQANPSAKVVAATK